VIQNAFYSKRPRLPSKGEPRLAKQVNKVLK
jgi:hypothetical protein